MSADVPKTVLNPEKFMEMSPGLLLNNWAGNVPKWPLEKKQVLTPLKRKEMCPGLFKDIQLWDSNSGHLVGCNMSYSA